MAKRLLEAIDKNESESRKGWMQYMFKFFVNNLKQNKEHMFWQKTSYLIELNNRLIFEQKRNYIHNNPLVAGMVTDENIIHTAVPILI